MHLKFDSVNNLPLQALGLDGQYLCSRDIRIFPLVKITGALKTLVAKNLSFPLLNMMVEFFKKAGEIVDVRFSLDYNGDFGGNCHIEFATAEAAIKAVELNGKYLFGRPVVLGFTRETICIQGFDTSLVFEQVQSSLVKFFSTCGEISWMHIPTFPYTDDSTLTVKDAAPVRLDVNPVGGRRGIQVIQIYPFRCYSPDRG
ncbi:hypothetical protein MKX01_033411 [Papaver californicum]|nr:hypothetical protein MKX01_033411 [Papaver californicum]